MAPYKNIKFVCKTSVLYSMYSVHSMHLYIYSTCTISKNACGNSAFLWFQVKHRPTSQEIRDPSDLSRCQFHQLFKRGFLYKSFAQSFLCLHFRFNFFCMRKNIGTNSCAHKMLVKLTIGVHFTNNSFKVHNLYQKPFRTCNVGIVLVSNRETSRNKNCSWNCW